MEAQRKVVKTESGADFNVGYFIQSFAGPQEVNGQTWKHSMLCQEFPRRGCGDERSAPRAQELQSKCRQSRDGDSGETERE